MTTIQQCFYVHLEEYNSTVKSWLLEHDFYKVGSVHQALINNVHRGYYLDLKDLDLALQFKLWYVPGNSGNY